MTCTTTRGQVRGTGAGFSDLCTHLHQLVLETEMEGVGHLPQLPTFRAVSPSLPRTAPPAIPLFKGEFSSPFFLLLQPPASFFQLGERVGCWIGRHGGILDERVRRLDNVPELGTDPRVHCNRSLDGEGSDHVMGQLFLST